MEFITNTEKFSHDLSEVIRSFSSLGDDVKIAHEFSENKGGYLVKTTIDGRVYLYTERLREDIFSSDVERTRIAKRVNKLAVYKAISEHYKLSHLWGSLTGIRPVKLYKSIMERENVDAEKYFLDYYLVSPQKTSLVKGIYEFQKKYYSKSDKDINLYIGIPFCLSRCYYCSFISQDIRLIKDKSIIDRFVDSLIIDIENAKRVIKENGFSLRSVYMGGGTPTALSAKQLERVLSVCDFGVSEFTVEGGRPDTIDEEKLQIISKVANRISVNPQTASDKTLEIIGRKHTFSDFLSAYELARKYNFEINCDLIAGLTGESAKDFERSILEIAKLSPENITVHTLALKAGSRLKELTDKNENDEIFSMLPFAYKVLSERGYIPYYLYRQKYMAGNLENTGFCKSSPCIYNIDIMEENTSIIACGSNAVSKRFFGSKGSIERIGFPKDVSTYIEKLEKNLCGREVLFEKD